MKSSFEGREVWFLTGSQGLYGDDALAQVASQSQNVVETLNRSGDIPVNIVWKPTLTDSDSIRRAILDANSNDNVLGVVAWMHTFSPAKMWIAGLNVLNKPLLHLNTQDNVVLPWATIDMDFMNLNQSAHGDREFGYILSRLGIDRETVIGSATDPAVRARVSKWVRACAGWAAIHDLNVVRFGDNMRNVAVTDGDKTEALKVFGVSVNTWGVNDLVEVVNDVADADIDALAAVYEDSYEVVPELRRGGDRHESLRYAARQEIALRRFLDERNASAFTDTFEDLGALRQLPGIAAQRLMADGYGFGAEGDWKTAVLVRTVKAMSEGLPGGASLMEDYTYNLVPGQELILGAHMLEICPSLTTQKPRAEIHPLGIGDREDPVRLVFSMDPSEAVVVSMADMGNRFRLTANVVDVVEPLEPLPNLPVAHAIWKPQPSLSVSAECWMESGAAHHTVMTNAIGVDIFRMFAQMAHTELAVIDKSTDVASFKNELRWNKAYFQLAQGL
ncbi:L-arabinose isomerase [Changpingibacter yushuensis]|uniref:L-arabinose isomerase n=1 Tax=Changpingibacter yushuensis TaxID=2758440 RepID=UPI00165D786A|nr:L-arabinose isomerase [Changpingibacter yushuensis]